MILGIDTNVPVAIALCDVEGGTFYNWSTRLVEAAPLNPAVHVKQTTAAPITLAAEPSGSPSWMPATLHANTKYVDCGNVLESYLNLAVIWYVVDVNGMPQSVEAIDSNPAQLQAVNRSAAVSH